jgi:hypothetical protein
VAAPTAPKPVTLMKSLRFIVSYPHDRVISLRVEACGRAWNIPCPIAIRKKPGLITETGLSLYDLRRRGGV